MRERTIDKVSEARLGKVQEKPDSNVQCWDDNDFIDGILPSAVVDSIMSLSGEPWPPRYIRPLWSGGRDVVGRLVGAPTAK